LGIEILVLSSKAYQLGDGSSRGTAAQLHLSARLVRVVLHEGERRVSYIVAGGTGKAWLRIMDVATATTHYNVIVILAAPYT